MCDRTKGNGSFLDNRWMSKYDLIIDIRSDTFFHFFTFKYFFGMPAKKVKKTNCDFFTFSNFATCQQKSDEKWQKAGNFFINSLMGVDEFAIEEQCCWERYDHGKVHTRQWTSLRN
jgi:hypothetical protein